jgi:RecA-family ATPase
MIVTRTWTDQPGKYFCISTKDRSAPDGEGWHEEFFTRKQFPLVARYIEEAKSQNLEVYWCPHGFTGNRRIARFVAPPKLMWADLDEVDPRGLGELKPSIAWETSPGRFAALWRLNAAISGDDANQKLTYLIGADKSGWDYTQLLRVPGSRNHKYPSTPRVKLLWQDGAQFDEDDIAAHFPKSKKRNPGTGDVNALFKKYRPFMTPWGRRELLKGNPRKGVRSEVFWKLTNELLEAGADEKEAFEILWASPWNKFKTRRDGATQLEREIEKVYNNKMDGLDPAAEYRADSDLPPGDDSDEGNQQGETKESELYASFMGIAEPETPRWVIYPYLLRGHITSIEGDPEVGKSWFSLAMCASIAERKKAFPVDGWDDQNKRGAVFYFDAENDIGNVAQRMSDSDMFTKVTNAHDSAPFFHVKLKLDFREEEAIDDVVERVEALLKLYKNTKSYEAKPALIIFDTFVNFAGDTDTNKQSDVMNALGNLKTLAEELDCAVCIIRHYGKTKHANAMHQGIGSTQFAATCRCMMGVHRHPDDPDTRVVTISKSSLASKSDLRTLSYSLESVFPGSLDINQRDRTAMKWNGWIDLSSHEIAEAMADSSKKEKEAKEGRVKLDDVLKSVFETDPITNEDANRQVPYDTLVEAIERAGLPTTNLMRTLKRAGYAMKGREKKRYFHRIKLNE